MPRGPQPDDARLFGEAVLPRLRAAVEDLAWLLGRGYALNSSLKLVGDRHDLNARQQVAVRRSTCTDAARDSRVARRVVELEGRALDIDGFNLLITVESALRGGVILCGRAGAFRDLASVHGTYRRSEETQRAIELVGETLAELGGPRTRWYFDQPVSNSGRAAEWIREAAAAHGWPWTAEVVPDPDPVLAASSEVVASSDGEILDRCAHWFSLAGAVVERHLPNAKVVFFDGSSGLGPA